MTAPRPALPLDLRAPNPPIPFLGRDQELDWLAAAAQRAPLTLIWGAPGVGKSALLSAWLAQRPARDAAIYLSAAPQADEEALAAWLLVELGRAGLLPDALDVAELGRRPLAALTTLIDAVDQHDHLVLLDDAHLLAPAALAPLLQRLARYTRRARWVVAGRDPVWTLPGQTLHLAPLPQTQRAQLVALWSTPGLSLDLDAHELLARGSLAELARIVGADSAAPLELAPEALSAPQRAALSLLLAAHHPLPTDALDALTGCDAAQREQLVRADLLRERAAGWLLTAPRGESLAQRLVPPSPAAISALVTSLTQAESVHLWLEAARLAVSHRLDEALDRLLTRRFDQMKARGALTQLWSWLREQDSPQLATWRLKCACELGDVHALGRHAEPAHHTWESLNLWISALHHMGKLDALAQLAADAPQHLAPPVDERERAHADMILLQRAGALLSLGRPDEAEALMATRGQDGSTRDWQADILTLRALAHRGQRDEALRGLAAHRARDWQLDPTAALRQTYALVYLYYVLQELEPAARLIAERLDAPGQHLVLFGAQWLLMAGVALETGDVERAQRFASHALLHSEAPTFNRASALGLCIAAAMLTGELAAARAHYDTLERELPSYPAEITAHANDTALRLNLLGGAPIVPPPLPADPDAISAEAREQVRITQTWIALLRDDAPPPLPPCEDDALPARAFHATLAAYAALRAGLPVELPALEAWADRLIAACWRRQALEVCDALCELALLTDSPQLTRCAQRLDALARRCGATRLAQEAALYEAWGAQAWSADDARRWLEAHPLALTAQRRVRAALGEPGELGAVDRMVVQRLRDKLRSGALSWGYDVDRREVFDGLGARVSLAHSATAQRFVCALAEAGGALGKEALTLTVWGEREYHPLRHDNRMRVLVKKLRQQLDEALGAHGWITTLEDGYALRQPFTLRGPGHHETSQDIKPG